MAQLLGIALLLISFQVSALAIEWIPLETPENNGNISSIDGNPVLDYNNAGRGGIDWQVSGIGPTGGLGLRELWLYDDSAAGIPGTSVATTLFSVISNSVGFVMAGDHNDGLAQLCVEDINVGTYELFQTGHRVLVVSGLTSIAHSLRIVQLGQHNPNSAKGDVAIIGGAAFNVPIVAVPEPEAYLMVLVGLGVIGLQIRSRRRAAIRR